MDIFPPSSFGEALGKMILNFPIALGSILGMDDGSERMEGPILTKSDDPSLMQIIKLKQQKQSHEQNID